MEILGPERRRRWSDETKARIVAESYTSGVSVSWVARKHGVAPSQLFAWRKLARERGDRLAEDVSRPAKFLPLELCAPQAVEAPPAPMSGDDRIEIVLANGRRLLVSPCSDPTRLARLAAALEAG